MKHIDARNGFMRRFTSRLSLGRVQLIETEPAIYRLAAARFQAVPAWC